MSLDVYLEIDKSLEANARRDTPININGKLRLLTTEEWDALDSAYNIDTEPDTLCVYWRNITHNLNKMAQMAGVYEYVWRPDELGLEFAEELIDPLTLGIAALKNDPDFYRRYNPSNGWGTYEGLVDFLESYLQACRDYPKARIRVSR